MPVPDYQTLMLPTLQALADGTEASVAEIRSRVVAKLGLSPEDVRKRHAINGQSVLANRMSWSLLYLERAGLLVRVRRAVRQLTPDGDRLLSENPSSLDRKTLQSYPAYVDWMKKQRSPSPEPEAKPETSVEPYETPDEALDLAFRRVQESLEAEVLHRVRASEPEFLEQVVVDLLLAMGYGGGDSQRGRVTGRSGDGGIDGTIREDALGLDEVYVQAKKYAEGNTVGEGDLRNFAGAIDAAGTTKGVFVTTAGFTKAAKRYVERSPKRIVLIEGAELARLMVRHGIGVRTWVRHEIKRIDEDYFDL